MEDAIHRILHLAEAGGYECEVYAESVRKFNVEIYRGDVESMNRSRDIGIAVRLVKDMRVGYSFSSNVTSSGVDAAFEEAKVNVSNSSPMEVDVLAERCELKGVPECYPRLPPEDMTHLKVDGVKEMERACFGFDACVVNTEGAGYSEIVGDVSVAGTRGFFRTERRGFCACSITAVVSRNAEYRSAWSYRQAVDPRDIDFGEVGRRAGERAAQMLGSERIATKRYPVIVDGVAFTNVLGLIEQVLSAEMVVKGTSVLAGKLGREVAPSIVTIVDDPFMNGGCFNASFDAEGMPKNRCVLFESGILRSYLHNVYSARKMGAPPTANAVRSSYRGLPVPGPTNMYIVGGERDVGAMIADLDEGVYVQDIMGMHTSDPISGDFSVGINGWYIRGGSSNKPIVEMIMSGNIARLLSCIREVSSQVEFVGSYGSPAVCIEDLSISGM